MQSVAKKRVGILRGGMGEHYGRSLKRGGDFILHIYENLSDKYKVVDILIDKDYLWHYNGLPIIPSDLMHKVDLVWNTTHPSFSNILESLGIPNIGVSPFSSALETSKQMLREHIKKINVSMPRSIIFPVYQKDFDACQPSQVGSRLGPRERYAIKKAKEVHEKFAPPWIVKSFTNDSDMGVHLAKTFNELVAGIEDGVKNNTSILVEEFIPGKVVSIHSVPDFRGDLPALPEGREQARDIYIFPPVSVFGNLTLAEKEKLSTLAKDLHRHLGTKHYLKSNFLLNPRGKVYLLDFDSTPNLNSYSHFAQACESVGAKMHQVVEHILERAT